MTWIADPWMAAEAEAKQRQSDRRFMLKIAGIPYQLHNSTAAPVQVYDSTPAPDVYYTALHCLHSVSDIDWQVEDAGMGPGARVAYQPITVTLAQTPELPADIRRYFDRGDRRQATWWAQVTATVDVADPCEVFIDRSPAALTFPRYFFVGRQVIRATGFAAAGAIWKLTGCTRGAGEALRQSIKADAISGRTPTITTEPIHFDGRDAVLWWQRYPGGTWRELMPGRLTLPPRVKGNVITLTINPMPNVLDAKISPEDLATEIVASHHLFQRIGCRVEHIQRVRLDAAFAEGVDAATIAGSQQVQSLAGRTEHAKFFDIVSSGNLGTGHPRNGQIYTKPSSTPYEPMSYATAPPFDGFNTPPGTPPIVVAANDQVRNAEAAEIIQAKIADDGPADADTLVDWPGGLVDAINDAEGWNRAAHTGEYGSWLRLTYNPQNSTLVVQRNVPPAPIDVIRYRDVPPRDPDARFWERDAAGDWQSSESITRLRLPASVWSAIQEGVDGSTTIRQNDNSLIIRDVPTPARSFYIPGELKLLTRDALTVPSAAGRLVVKIQQGDRSAEAQITNVAQQLDGGGNLVGYVCTLDERHAAQDRLPLLVQSPTDDPITVTPVIRAFDGTSGSLMLQLLCSVEGEGVNGAYDTLVVGCAIPEAYVDAPSFLAVQDPPGIDWSPVFGQGQSAQDFFRVVGLLTSSIVDVVRSADGSAKITRIPLQPAIDAPPFGALGVAAYPSQTGSDTIINAINWKANPDQDGKPTWSWSSRDQASIAEHRPRKPIEIEVPGFLPTDAAGRLAVLRSLEVRFFERYGNRRKVWQVQGPTHAGLRQHALAAASITTDKLISIDGGLGVADETVQVMRGRIELQGEGASIEVEPNFIRGAGWNVSALVVGIDGAPWPGTDLVTYPAAETVELSPTVDGQGDHDAAYFVVGDEILCVPAGDTDAAVTRTVIGVHEANDRITLNNGSGLAGPDYGDIWTGDYDTSSTVRRERVTPKDGAFFADASGTLGAAGDDGREVL